MLFSEIIEDTESFLRLFCEYFLDHLPWTLMFRYVYLIVDPLHDEERETRCCYDTEYDRESHSRPESIAEGDREDTEGRRDGCEEHRFEAG